MDELALRATRVVRQVLLPGGRQVHERPGELAGLGVRRGLGRAAEVGDGLQVFPLAQVRLAVVQRPLIEGYAASHRNPAGAAGGASGLRGSPATGSGALYPPGATSFAVSG